MASSQITSQPVEPLKSSSCSASCPPGFEDQPPPKIKPQTSSITQHGDGENDTSIINDEDVFEPETPDSKLTVQIRPPYKPVYKPHVHPVNTPLQYVPQYNMLPLQYVPQYIHEGDTYLTASPPQLISSSMAYYQPRQLVPSCLPNVIQDPYSRYDVGQFDDYNYINKLTANHEKKPSPENRVHGFQKSRREIPEKANSRLSTNSDILLSPRSMPSSNVRPTSQGSDRSRTSQNSFKTYRNYSPRNYSKQYSEQNLYIAGFNQEYNFDKLKSDIIKVINDFGHGIEITEDDFNVQVKESNKDIEATKRPMTERSLVSTFNRLDLQDENENDAEYDEEKVRSPRTPSKNYAFLDFESKELANQVLELLALGRDHLRDQDLRRTIECTFGESFTCKKAKKQNQDTTNVFFKGQPENFRNEEEYQNPDNAKNSSPPSTPKIHSYNEQEIVLTAIHIYLLSADAEKAKNVGFDNADWFGEHELKKVVSLRIQSDSKTKKNDSYPGLICLIRYKYEEDAKRIIKIFGGTEDEKDASNKPKKFLEAKPDNNTTILLCLFELPPEPLITIIKQLKKIDWPKFGDNSENGKKVSNVGEKAWEKAIQFCKDEKYKQIVGDSDLIEVKHANTAQERKSPEKYNDSIGDTFSPSSSYRSSYTPKKSLNNYTDVPSSPRNYSRHSYFPRAQSYHGRYTDHSFKTPGRANNINWRNKNVKPSPLETIRTINPSPLTPRRHSSEFKANVRSEVSIKKNERGSGTSKLNAFRNLNVKRSYREKLTAKTVRKNKNNSESETESDQ